VRKCVACATLQWTCDVLEPSRVRAILYRHRPDPNNIFLTDGASVGVRMCLNAIIRDKRDAIMVPVPQYPLYSASIALYDGSFEGYYLDESKGWAMDMDNLQKTVDNAVKRGKMVRGLVFINPGNPTGQCLTKENLEGLVKFAVHNKIALFADEVYQPNIYQDEKLFISARYAAARLYRGVGCACLPVRQRRQQDISGLVASLAHDKAPLELPMDHHRSHQPALGLQESGTRHG
jgi:hypothetical protein